MESSNLDTVDYAILYHLQNDARETITAIADQLNVSDNTVRNRIANLEEQGVIDGYQVNVDYDSANVQHHYVFVCSARVRRREEFARKARTQDGVVEVITLMTGNNNVYVIGVADSKDEITELAYALDEMGLEIEGEYLIRDHIRQPYSGFELDSNI